MVEILSHEKPTKYTSETMYTTNGVKQPFHFNFELSKFDFDHFWPRYGIDSENKARDLAQDGILTMTDDIQRELRIFSHIPSYGKNDRSRQEGMRLYSNVLVVFWPRKRTFEYSVVHGNCVRDTMVTVKTCAHAGDLDMALRYLDVVLSDLPRTCHDTDDVASVLSVCAVIGTRATRFIPQLLSKLVQYAQECPNVDSKTCCWSLKPSLAAGLAQVCKSVGLQSIVAPLQKFTSDIPLNILDVSFVVFVGSPEVVSGAPQLEHTIFQRILATKSAQSIKEDILVHIVTSVIQHRRLHTYASSVSSLFHSLEIADNHRSVTKETKLAVVITHMADAAYESCTSDIVSDDSDFAGRGCNNVQAGNDSTCITSWESTLPLLHTSVDVLRLFVKTLFETLERLHALDTTHIRDFCACVFACRDAEISSMLMKRTSIYRRLSGKNWESLVIFAAMIYDEVYSSVDAVLGDVHERKNTIDCSTYFLVLKSHLESNFWELSSEKKERSWTNNGVLQETDMCSMHNIHRRWLNMEGKFDQAKYDCCFLRLALELTTTIISISPPQLTYENNLTLIKLLCKPESTTPVLLSLVRDLCNIACENALDGAKELRAKNQAYYGRNHHKYTHISLRESPYSRHIEAGLNRDDDECSSVSLSINECRVIADTLLRMCEWSETSDSDSDSSLIDACLEKWGSLGAREVCRLLIGLGEVSGQKRYPGSRTYDPSGKHVKHCLNRLGDTFIRGTHKITCLTHVQLHVLMWTLLSLRKFMQHAVDLLHEVASAVLGFDTQEEFMKLVFDDCQVATLLHASDCAAIRTLARRYMTILNQQPSATRPAGCDFSYTLAVHSSSSNTQAYLRGPSIHRVARCANMKRAIQLVCDSAFESSMHANKYNVAHRFDDKGSYVDVHFTKCLAPEVEELKCAYEANRAVYNKLLEAWPALGAQADMCASDDVTCVAKTSRALPNVTRA
jgi:hypothetical protein